MVKLPNNMKEAALTMAIFWIVIFFVGGKEPHQMICSQVFLAAWYVLKHIDGKTPQSDDN